MENSSLTALAKDIEVAVCDAALRWEHHHVAEQTDQPDLAVHDSGVIAEVPQKKSQDMRCFRTRCEQSRGMRC